MAQKTSFYVSDELNAVLPKYIERYGSVSKAVTNAILSMDTMYRTERRVLRNLFNEQEINLMLNNALSTAYIPQAVAGAVLADTEDEINTTFDYYGVDRETILKKLRELTLSQQYALVDWLIEMRAKAGPELEE